VPFYLRESRLSLSLCNFYEISTLFAEDAWRKKRTELFVCGKTEHN
jgi:hypothetical protein